MFINRIGRKTGATKAQVLALGPTLFLDADSVPGSDGDAIGTWSDESGNAAHFTESSNKPLLKKAANGINGHNVLRFDGTNDLLTCAKALSTIIAAAADTCWLVFKIIVNDTNSTTLYFNDTAIGAMSWGLTFRTSNGINAFIYNGVYLSKTQSVSTSTPYIARSRRTSGTIYLRIDGGTEGSAAGGNVSGLTDKPTLGTDGTVIFTRIDIAEIIVFNSALPADSMAIVDAYLKEKYATY